MASSNPLSIIVAIKFIELLSKDFEEWEAFKLGLIDSKGKKIRQAVTPREKKMFSSWYNLVRNVKRTLLTVPGGSSKFASYATAFALLKEQIVIGSGTRDIGEAELILKEFIDRDNKYNVLESLDQGDHLAPGKYFLKDGPMKYILEENDQGVIFEVKEKIRSSRTPFGNVFVINENNRRIVACRKTISRL